VILVLSTIEFRQKWIIGISQRPDLVDFREGERVLGREIPVNKDMEEDGQGWTRSIKEIGLHGINVGER
jgi:hypothetical protein